MKVLVIITLLSLACMVVAMKPMPRFKIDIGTTPPDQRFTESINFLLDTKGWNVTFGPIFEYHNKSLFDKLTPEIFNALSINLINKWPENAAELQGIAKAFRNRGYYVSFEYMAAWAHFHELRHASDLGLEPSLGECSASVVKDPNGVIYHGRNMDQVPTPYLREIALHHVFYDHGKLLGHTACWYWFSGGAMSGMTSCGERVSLQENWRGDNHPLSFILDRLIKQNVMPQKFFFRNVITTACRSSNFGYEDVVRMTSRTPFACGMYIILGGARGDGIIMSLAANGTLPSVYLNNNTYSKWFIAQANSDPWESTPDNDPRRQGMIDMFNLLATYDNEPASPDGVMAVMSGKPQGHQGTVYTLVMSPTLGTFHAYVADMIGWT